MDIDHRFRQKTQAISIVLSLPEECETKIREKVFFINWRISRGKWNECSFKFLDKHLSKDDLIDSLDKFEDFDNIERKDEQSISRILLCVI